MPISDLQTIREKVRRLTRSPSESQLTNNELDQYVNTFIVYDFPENLRLFSLRTLFKFWTQPNIDTYATNTTDVNDPLYNFKNKYISIHPPLFVAGVQCYYTQQRNEFYGYYPQTNSIIQLPSSGNATVGPFTGTTGHFILQNSVNVTCLDATTNAAMILIDYPIDRTMGALGIPGLTTPPVFPYANGTINYLTGAYTITFPATTLSLAPIFFTAIFYQPGKTIAILYFDEKFVVRPIPDKVYEVSFEVFIRPTELLASNQEPYLSQWWQYIAFGTAVKIFYDRMDTDSVNFIMPEFLHQEMLVQRSTLEQATNERTQTIYTQGKQNFWGGWGGSSWPY